MKKMSSDEKKKTLRKTMKENKTAIVGFFKSEEETSTPKGSPKPLTKCNLKLLKTFLIHFHSNQSAIITRF